MQDDEESPRPNLQVFTLIPSVKKKDPLQTLSKTLVSVELSAKVSWS